jgi:hypothetical protein
MGVRELTVLDWWEKGPGFKEFWLVEKHVTQDCMVKYWWASSPLVSHALRVSLIVVFFCPPSWHAPSLFLLLLTRRVVLYLVLHLSWPVSRSVVLVYCVWLFRLWYVLSCLVWLMVVYPCCVCLALFLLGCSYVSCLLSCVYLPLLCVLPFFFCVVGIVSCRVSICPCRVSLPFCVYICVVVVVPLSLVVVVRLFVSCAFLSRACFLPFPLIAFSGLLFCFIIPFTIRVPFLFVFAVSSRICRDGGCYVYMFGLGVW